MRILLIHNFYQYYGGEETYFHNLVKLLQNNKHEVIIYTKNSERIRTFKDKAKAALGLFWNYRTSKDLNKIIKKHKPQIAHFNNVYPLIGNTAYWICRHNKVPIIQTVHNYRFMSPKGILFRKGKICELCVKKQFPLWSVIYGCYHSSNLASLIFSLAYYFNNLIGTYRLIDRWIFPSVFTQNYYLENLEIEKTRGVFLPHFICTEPIQKVQKKNNYYLYIGRLSEEKGILNLLRVFKSLPYAEVKIFGQGPLNKEVEQYKKFTNIKIYGFRETKVLRKYLIKAKALIVPSLSFETFSLVTLEAKAYKVPVIVPNIGVFKKLAKDQLSYKYYNFKHLRNIIMKLEKSNNIEKTFNSIKILDKDIDLNQKTYHEELINIYYDVIQCQTKKK